MKYALILVWFLPLITLTSADTSGTSQKIQDNKPAALDQMIEMDLSEATLFEVLNRLAIEHRVPVGLEEALDSQQRINRSIYIQSGTLKSVLGFLTTQEPRYSWELRNGVINVIPVVARDELLEQFLATKIARFVPPKGTTDKFEIRDAIMALPEVKHFLELNHLGIQPYSYAYGRSIYSNDNVDLRITNTDVRGVLNHVARESEHKSWSVSRVGPKRENILLSY
jgi:hypothetical protein